MPRQLRFGQRAVEIQCRDREGTVNAPYVPKIPAKVVIAIGIALRAARGSAVSRLPRATKSCHLAWWPSPVLIFWILICAQNCIDISTHLAASAGRDLRDYASAIDSLVPMGILEPDFAARFRAVAGFRDLLVHGYLDVDVSRVHRLLNDGLDDFTVFADCVRRVLDAG